MNHSILGILNITEDSFSDGGRYLAVEAALAHARKLARDGASVLDLGAAASNPDAKPVAPAEEIARLAPVVAALKEEGLAVSIDSFAPEVQRWALTQRVDYLNDIHGFPDPALYPALADASPKLIVMHSVQERGRATRADVAPGEIFDRILRFFEGRVAALKKEGLAVSIDSFAPEVQRWALTQRVDYLNDIQGFPDPGLYPELAGAKAQLIVMHSVQQRGRATRVDVAPGEIFDRIRHFFEDRIATLERMRWHCRRLL